MMNWQEEQRVTTLARSLMEQAGFGHVRLGVKFSGRMTTALGKAIVYRDGRNPEVRFSRVIWPKADPAERDNTVAHEVAHVIAGLKYGENCGHDWRWRRTMQALGYTPTRCHTVDREGIQARRAEKRARTGVHVPCACGTTVRLSTRMANKCIRNRSGVRHVACGRAIHWDKIQAARYDY
jgi:predicted SprT family Zn-dependent metalloprotease